MIRVLVVDDSALVCRILSKELGKEADMEVIGTARDAYEARDKIVALRPHVVTLDVEMPRMNGLTFLGKLMGFYPIPVIVVSSQTTEGSETALSALELGAVDVVAKPVPPQTLRSVCRSLAKKIRGAAKARRPHSTAKPTSAAAPPRRDSMPSNPAFRVLALGASTGGTEAIREILQNLPADFPGIVIVQHMPPTFTTQFAERLDSLCAMTVREAAHGDVLSPGLALIAPGDRHMVLTQEGKKYAVALKNGPAVHHQRPSVDVLFHSVAAIAGPEAVGALLTGMGCDGARGLLAMREAGAPTLAQDEATSVVFGMPKEAIERGAVDHVVPLNRMADRIIETFTRSETRRAAPVS